MTNQPHRRDTSGGPSDDELVDYLLQSPPADGDCRFVNLERWLASDEANLIRLESIAETVLIAAGGLTRSEQQTLRPAAERPATSLSAADMATSADVSSRSIASSPPGPNHSPAEPSRRFPLSVRWATLTLAATLLIAIGWRFGLFSVEPLPGPATERVALAWSEIDSIRSLDDWETAEEIAIEWEEPPAVATWDGAESVTHEDDAVAGEAPPEWMLIAVTRMSLSEIPTADTTDDDPEKLR